VRRATDGARGRGIAPSLPARDVRAGTPDAVRLADIGCASGDEGRRHLGAVKDPATMEIVGRSMSDRLKGRLAIDAAHGAAQPKAGAGPDPPLRAWRSRRLRRLSQAAESAWGARLAARRGRSRGALQAELVRRSRRASRRGAGAGHFEGIAIFCNHRRRHANLGRRTSKTARIDMARAMAAR